MVTGRNFILELTVVFSAFINVVEPYNQKSETTVSAKRLRITLARLLGFRRLLSGFRRDGSIA